MFPIPKYFPRHPLTTVKFMTLFCDTPCIKRETWEIRPLKFTVSKHSLTWIPSRQRCQVFPGSCLAVLWLWRGISRGRATWFPVNSTLTLLWCEGPGEEQRAWIQCATWLRRVPPSPNPSVVLHHPLPRVPASSPAARVRVILARLPVLGVGVAFHTPDHVTFPTVAPCLWRLTF